ncbi:NADPH-adrenodoxin reductase [Tulasnella sp. 425]|nr:NADPH-adrenodoxin reductase [Tulasnella sp. 425]
MPPQSGNLVRPLKLAVVGAGPSAFYAASRVLSKLPASTPQGEQTRVHMYDKSWAPHGLVRYGVAPDHPEVKARLQATPALDIVHWYTGHPTSPAPPPLDKVKHLTLIGHGNVSLDIARLLLTPPSVLAKLDIPDEVIEVLKRSTVEEIEIVSRRGPAEVAFTAKELRELLALPNAALEPIPEELLVTPPGASRQQSRILDLLRKGSHPKGTSPPDARKTKWKLVFFRSPRETKANDGAVDITYDLNTLDEQRRAKPTGQKETRRTDLVVSSVGSRAVPFDRKSDTTTTVTTTSQSGETTSKSSTTDPWFDPALGRIRNDEGRVLSLESDSSSPTLRLVKNVYTSGWASHGAKGVLASTMYDAYEVADRLLSDHLSSSQNPRSSEALSTAYDSSSSVEPMNPSPSLESAPDAVERAVRGEDGKRAITWPVWKAIEAEEKRLGATKGKEAERMQWKDVEAFLEASKQ